MINKVYIVAISGVETYWIKHICASEATARKRFKELKIEMLQEVIESIMFDISEYNNNEGVYAQYPKEKEDYLKFHMDHSNEQIKLLSTCTFEKAATWIHNKPICDIYELEE